MTKIPGSDFLRALGLLCTLACLPAFAVKADDSAPQTIHLDGSQGADWPGYGRTYGEQHYSPLTRIDTSNVADLGLAWHMDLDQKNSVTQPIAVDGVLYFATGFSVVHAVDAHTGKLLWTYDPQAASKAGINLRLGWGSRGISWWNGKIFTATQDGRLIAIDATTGTMIWETRTYSPTEARYISAAPRIFDGRVYIGNAGDMGAVRGFVAAYDAETGRFLWRFYTVPGDPADGFESEIMERAAKTWAGEWWKYGGGGTVWNSIAYDPDTHTMFIGTGNGYPWNRKIRSADQGDNLFVCSIVALDARDGSYRWHYQINPGETWDYNAAMDVQLAELEIQGKPRKVVMSAPKNGFFYVIDRNNGKLISAEPIARVTWASGIDLETGRPIETPGSRYPTGTSFELWPSPFGAHNWYPMSYNPITGLVYIPTGEMGAIVGDSVTDYAKWEAPRDRNTDNGMYANFSAVKHQLHGTGALLAWNPRTQRQVWRHSRPSATNGGVMSTAGKLVFQGTIAGEFHAYDAQSGKLLWSFDAGAPILAPPATYLADDRQYVTVLTGSGNAAGIYGPMNSRFGIDPRTQARRVLSFALGGTDGLPPRRVAPDPLPDPQFVRDDAAVDRGAKTYDYYCVNCHGITAISGTHAPDLRRSPMILDQRAFANIVQQGSRITTGMPEFPEISTDRLESLRHYLRARADELRRGE